jgi:hypothetical protein
MPIKFHIPGLGDLVADTAEEVFALKRLMDSTPTEKPVAEPRRTERAASTAPTRDSLKEALALLRTLAEAKPKPVTSEKVGQILGVKRLKGLGSVLARIKVVIVGAGFRDTDEVFKHERRPLGREYTAGPRIHEAITALKEQE